MYFFSWKFKSSFYMIKDISSLVSQKAIYLCLTENFPSLCDQCQISWSVFKLIWFKLVVIWPFYITLLNILQNYYSKEYTLANNDLVYLSQLSNFFLQYIIELNSGLPGLCYWAEDFQILRKLLNYLEIIWNHQNIWDMEENIVIIKLNV